MADRVIVMSEGKIAMEGTPKEVFSRVEEVKALHLDVPQSAELCHALTEAGLPMPVDVIDVDECARALYKAITGKEAGECPQS